MARARETEIDVKIAIKKFFRGKKCKHCGHPKTIYDFTFCPKCKKKVR